MTRPGNRKGKVGPVSKSAALGQGLAGAITVLIVYAFGQFGVDIPETVAAAIAVILGSIGTMVGGKIVRPEKTIAFQQHQDQLLAEVG